MLSRRAAILGGGAALVAGGGAYALLKPEGFVEYDAKPVFSEDGAAIRGADAVAYFEQGEPVIGTAENSFDWNGAAWRFVSDQNRAAFEAEPERFAPQYGGFCAWAIAAKGKLYSTQPKNWTIVEDKLYLNYDDDIQAKWEADIAGFIAEGDRRWSEVMASAA